MQIIILLDFAYEWNDAWVEKEEPKYNFFLLLASLGVCACTRPRVVVAVAGGFSWHLWHS